MMKSILLLILLALSTCTPIFASDHSTEQDATEAYYRGVYSFCMVLNAKALESGASKFFDCDEMVKGAYRLKWHEREAPGFEWPPLQETPEPKTPKHSNDNDTTS